MSTTAYTEQEGTDVIDRVEQQNIIQRASVEPESLTETDSLLGYSKRPVPKRVYMLCSVLILYALCLLFTASADVDVLYIFVCYFSDIERGTCLQNDTANEIVAKYLGVSSMLDGVLKVGMSTYLSIMSDRIGRKPIMMATLVLSCVAQAMTWFVVFHYDNPPSYWILLIPTLIDGLGGSLPFFVQLCIAYISDMVPDVSHRTKLVSTLEGIVFASVAVGPSMGSLLIKKIGIEPLYVCTIVGLACVNVLAFFSLRESLSAFHQRRNSTNKKSVVSNFKLLKFDHITDAVSRTNARILAFCAIISKVVFMASQAIVILYPRRKFGWSAVECGFLVSVFSGTATFWYLLGFPFLYSKFSKIWPINSEKLDRVDLLFLRLTLLFAIVGFLMMGYSKTQVQYFVGGTVDATSAIGKAVFTSALIKYLPAGQYGAFMASFNFIFSALSTVAPMIMLRVYTWALYWRPFLPYELVAAVMGFFLILTLFMRPFS